MLDRAKLEAKRDRRMREVLRQETEVLKASVDSLILLSLGDESLMEQLEPVCEAVHALHSWVKANRHPIARERDD